jgi:hypothetical protein
MRAVPPRKTQTRRRTRYWLKKKPGDRITVVHQGQYLGWTKVVRVWEQRSALHVTDKQAKAEGYADFVAFQQAWSHLYFDCGAFSEPIVAIEFEPVRWIGSAG